jgi:hypothetical protein
MLMSMSLRAMVDVVARRFGQHDRVVTGNLHTDGIGFAGMIAAAQRLACVPQAWIGRGHFGHGQARTQPLAQLAKRLVGDAGHGGQDHGRINAVLADQHGAHCSGPAWTRLAGHPREGGRVRIRSTPPQAQTA